MSDSFVVVTVCRC